MNPYVCTAPCRHFRGPDLRTIQPAWYSLKTFRLAGVAQLVEQLIRNQQVVGSSPTAGSNFLKKVSRCESRVGRCPPPDRLSAPLDLLREHSIHLSGRFRSSLMLQVRIRKLADLAALALSKPEAAWITESRNWNGGPCAMRARLPNGERARARAAEESTAHPMDGG